MNPNPHPSPRIVLLLVTITSFMTAFMGSSLNIALPIIGKEFNSPALLLSWISTIYLVITAALLLPVGRFSDIKGRVKYYKLGILLFTAGSILSAFSPNTTFLLITRALQGFGSAFIFSTSTAILVSVFPVSQRGKALGITVAAVYTGLSSGPFLGGLITHYWDWRGIFIINAAIGIVLIVFTNIKFRYEWEELMNEKFDLSGSILYILMVIVFMLGLSTLPSKTGLIILISAVILSVVFYKSELKKEYPVFNLKLFGGNRTFTFSNIAALINYSATFAIGFLLSFFLQIVKGLSPQDAGIILITQPVVQAVFSPLSGKLSDKYEPQLVASTGMGILTIGLIVFVFLNPATDYFIVVLNLAFLGLGFALFSSPNVNAVMSSVEKKYYGVASSTLASMRLIGQMFSMGIVIVIFNIFIGHAKISISNQESFMSSSRTAFILFSVLSFFGIFASLSRGKIHK
jgi:EmrB/QacA subfamily drug resistance transporter